MHYMRLKKYFRRALLIVIISIALFAGRYIYLSVPLISAFGAKTFCSSIYLQQRDPETVIKEDLSQFPFSLADYKVNASDSSVSVTVFGLAKRKAIFRKRLGATLINDYTEEDIRKQIFDIPPAPIQPDTLCWPYGSKSIDTIPEGINITKLNEILQQEIEGSPGKPTTTRALVVVYKGKLIAEQYTQGFSKNTVMPAWSAAKSITGCLIGILVKEGKLNINTPANIPLWMNTPKQSIAIKNLLQQTSGLDYTEQYLYPSEATNMLFRKGNMADYAERLPLKYTPGTVFNYSSGNSNILSDIIKRTVAREDYASFPYTKLLYKTGMYSATLEPDASGMYVGSSYCYATARDFAKFGLFCLNNGKWNNEQILPENWIALCTQPVNADPYKRYGAQFWLNGFDKTDPHKHEFPDVPGDMYYASGFGGQGIFMIPSKQLVIVRLGLKNTDANSLIAKIISSVNA